MGVAWIWILWAQQAAAAAAGPDIVVTGERHARSKQQTASSVVVYTPDQIDRLGAADRLDTLLALTPNVQTGSGGEAPTIRGQDSTGVIRDLPAFLGGTKPRTTLQVDGRPADYFEFIFGLNSLWDVDKVEIFRSPQTVTQGRNAIAGAIFVTTRDPADRPEARARAILSDAHRRQLSASASTSLVDGLSARLAFDWGRVRPSSDLAHLQVGASPDIDKQELARLSVKAEPSHSLTLRSTLTRSHSQAPQFVGIRAPFRERKDPNATYGVFGTWVTAGTFRADWRISPRVDSGTTVTLTKARFRRFAPPGLGQAKVRKSTGTIEQVLRWKASDTVEGLAGLHVLDERTDQVIDISALSGIGMFDDHQTSFGLFGEVDWKPVPTLELQVAGRLQRDRQDRSGAIRGARTNASLDYRGRFDAFLPKVSFSWTPEPTLTLGAMVQKASNPGGSTLLLNGVVDRYDAESLWDAEIFGRGRNTRSTLHWSINLFDQRFRNAQRTLRSEVPSPSGPVTISELANAPRARARGAEAELQWRASPSLSLNVGVGLLWTRLTRTLLPSDPIRGNQFQRAPHMSVAAGADWRPVPRLTLSATVRGTSGYFSDDLNTPSLRIGSGALAEAKLRYDAGPASVGIYARNLFDRYAINFYQNPTLATAPDPREVGIGIASSF